MSLQTIRLTKPPQQIDLVRDDSKISDQSNRQMQVAAAQAAVVGVQPGEQCSIDSVLAQVLIDAGAAV